MTTQASERETCPWCRENLEYEVNGVTYSRATLVEIQGVYDGGLFYAHTRPDGCGKAWPRWPYDSGLGKRALSYIDEWNQRETDRRYEESDEAASDAL